MACFCGWDWVGGVGAARHDSSRHRFLGFGADCKWQTRLSVWSFKKLTCAGQFNIPDMRDVLAGCGLAWSFHRLPQIRYMTGSPTLLFSNDSMCNFVPSPNLPLSARCCARIGFGCSRVCGCQLARRLTCRHDTSKNWGNATVFDDI